MTCRLVGKSLHVFWNICDRYLEPKYFGSRYLDINFFCGVATPLRPINLLEIEENAAVGHLAPWAVCKGAATRAPLGPTKTTDAPDLDHGIVSCLLCRDCDAAGKVCPDCDRAGRTWAAARVAQEERRLWLRAHGKRSRHRSSILGRRQTPRHHLRLAGERQSHIQQWWRASNAAGAVWIGEVETWRVTPLLDGHWCGNLCWPEGRLEFFHGLCQWSGGLHRGSSGLRCGCIVIPSLGVSKAADKRFGGSKRVLVHWELHCGKLLHQSLWHPLGSRDSLQVVAHDPQSLQWFWQLKVLMSRRRLPFNPWLMPFSLSAGGCGELGGLGGLVGGPGRSYDFATGQRCHDTLLSRASQCGALHLCSWRVSFVK